VAVIYFSAQFQQLRGGTRQVAGNVGHNIWSGQKMEPRTSRIDCGHTKPLGSVVQAEYS